MLTIANLTKDYPTVRALDRLSLEVPAGEVFGLLGPNGAGKTTALRIVMRIIAPTSGEVRFNGPPISRGDLDRVGYLPEERGLYRNSVSRDAAIYFAELKGLSSAQAAKNVDRDFERFGMGEIAEKKIGELSKGNQQKVQIVAALAHDPDLVILDEPFSGFDPVNQETILELTRELAAKGRAILVSTHQMELAEELCDRIALLNRGDVALRGTPSELRRQGKATRVRLRLADPAERPDFPDAAEVETLDDEFRITLKPGVEPSAFIRAVSATRDVIEFAESAPTLRRVFLDAVKGGDDE
ncbi:MAG: ATP-binding cassette domain-containing protein [Ignavibacteriales bacterium]|nr:ATP-binding cassette domain-containing protein [Ignavibacteriales bacterium]